MPVTDQDRRVVGALSATDLIHGYHRALDAHAGYVYNVTQNALAVEERVGRGSPAAGRLVRDAGPAPGLRGRLRAAQRCLLTYATGSTEIAPGDTLSVLVAADQVGQLRERLRGKDSSPSPRVGSYSFRAGTRPRAGHGYRRTTTAEAAHVPLSPVW